MTDSNQRVEVQFGGTTKDLEAAASQSANFVRRFADTAREASEKVKTHWGSMGPLFGGVASAVGGSLGGEGSSALGSFGGIAAQVASDIKEKWGGLPPVFKSVASAAGIMMLSLGALMVGKRFADHTAEDTEALRDLARALGLTTNEASAYRAALEDVGVSEGEFTGLAKGMVRQLKEHEAAMNKAGLVTRDANGHFKNSAQLVLDGVEVLKTYKEGTDRTIASTILFGRSMDASSRVMTMTKDTVNESRAAIKELHLEVGEASTAAWADYDRAADRASLTMKAFGKAIGDSVMPVVTELTDWFNSMAPAAITVLRGALAGLSTAFLGLTNGIVIFWEVGKAALFSMTDPLVQFGTALMQLASGDMNGATKTMMGIPDRIGKSWETMWDNVSASSQRTADRVKNMWAFATGGEGKAGDKGAGKDGGKSASGLTGGGSKEKLPESYMQFYEAVLTEEKNVYAATHAGRQLRKQDEWAYWQNVLAYARTTTADTSAIVKKSAELEIAIAAEKRARIKAASEADIGHEERMGEIALSAARQHAEAELALGNITKEQMAVAEQEFENRRYAIKVAALEQRKALLDPDMDPILYRQIKQQIEEAELEHQAKLAGIKDQSIVQQSQRSMQVWGDLASRMSSLWDQGVGAMMNGTFRWSNALRAIGGQVLGWFANSVIKPMVMQWIFGENMKTGATVAGTAARTAAEGFAAAKSVMLWASTAVTNIMNSAWEAMAGAWKAMVGIPYVGPFLAVGAAAAAFAGVSAIAGNIMSAEGGYDIPSGVNPLVQTHANEMILPAPLADVIRGLEGGSGGSGNQATLNVHPLPGGMYGASQDEFVRFFKKLQANRYV